MESKKHYNLSTTEDNGQSITTTNTSTEHPAEILRMMQLAGMETAHMVHQHEESIEEEVDSEFKPTPANDKLDLDDYSKKSPESINKQQKSIQPNHGDNPLEYSIDESEIYEGLMKEFDASEQLAEERVDEFLPLVGAAVGALARGVAGAVIRNPIKSMAAASLLKKNEPEPVNASSKKKGKKLNAVKEEEVNEEQLDELLPLIPMAVGAVAGSLMSSKKSKNKDKKLNAVKEGDESLYDDWHDMCFNVDAEKGISVVFDMKNMPEKRFHVTTSDSGEAGNPGHDHVFVSIDSGMSDHDGDDHLELEDVKNNMTGAALTAQVDGKVKILKTIGSFKNWDDVLPPEPRDPDLSKYPDEDLVDSVSIDEDDDEEGQSRMRELAGIKELEEAQSPAQKAAFAKMLAAKKGKKDDTVEETTEETTEEVVTEEKVSEDCSCGHDSSCDCSSDCDCGCNAMNEDQIRLAKLVKY